GKMRSLIVYTLTNVLISQLSVSGGAGGKPVETMSLNFTKIKWQITAEKSDGAQQESRMSVWDLAMDQIGK
ncbi:type VI secretion system tube protein Hcp, partial [Salmonella enterica subsp. enterica serovar Infantis]|nr:type VI secretion system tube protein Hcp [Salmonella enterica subsp. enterica serovar Infantis]